MSVRGSSEEPPRDGRFFRLLRSILTDESLHPNAHNSQMFLEYIDKLAASESIRFDILLPTAGNVGNALLCERLQGLATEEVDICALSRTIAANLTRATDQSRERTQGESEAACLGGADEFWNQFRLIIHGVGENGQLRCQGFLDPSGYLRRRIVVLGNQRSDVTELTDSLVANLSRRGFEKGSCFVTVKSEECISSRCDWLNADLLAIIPDGDELSDNNLVAVARYVNHQYVRRVAAVVLTTKHDLQFQSLPFNVHHLHSASFTDDAALALSAQLLSMG